MTNATQITGRVLNESGDVVSGAAIVAVGGKHLFQRHPIDVVLSEGNGLYDNPHFAVTDATGRFKVAGTLVSNATLSVSIVADGYAPLRLPHEWLPESAPLDLGDLVLSEGHSVSGTVVDETGDPLPDVQVLMAIDRGVPGCLQCFPGRGIPLTRTDSHGRFTAVGLLTGPWMFIFDKPGYRVAQAQGNLFNNPFPDALTIVLGRGRSISGRVPKVPAGFDGPLMVEARPIRRSVDYCKEFPSRARPRRALVQTDGSFQIEGLNEEAFVPQIKPGVLLGYHPEWTVDEGQLDVWLVVGRAVEPNRRMIESPEFQACRVEAGATNVELPWLGRANLSARVVNEAGKAIEQFAAEVRYQGAFGQDRDSHEPMILPGGRIELRNYAFWDTHLQYWQPARKVWLVIAATGFEERSVEIQDQLVRGKHTNFGDIVLAQEEPQGTGGVVVESNSKQAAETDTESADFTITIRESDRPVIGAKLKMMPAALCTQDGEYYDTPWQGFTSDRGTYRFRNIPVGECVLLCKHDDRHMVGRRSIVVARDMEPIDWLLDNNTITGQLVDSDGHGHAWKRIGITTDIAGYCQRNNDGITYENGHGGLDWFWSNQAINETWTDGNGNFHLRGLVAGLPISLYTRHGELEKIEKALDPLQDGEQRVGVDFVVQLSGNKGWRGG